MYLTLFSMRKPLHSATHDCPRIQSLARGAGSEGMISRSSLYTL